MTKTKRIFAALAVLGAMAGGTAAAAAPAVTAVSATHFYGTAPQTHFYG